MTAAPPRLVLASTSPARAAMLEAAGVAVARAAPSVDERTLDAAWSAEGRSPADIARRLAEAKALSVSSADPEALVIGADQTLALGDQRFSKPASVAEARDHLKAFRGRIHHLHSGVALARGGTILFATVESAAMQMRTFSDAFLDDYLATMGEAVTRSVGCYQLEGRGLQLFERIDGDYFTILGLPLLPLLAALRWQGCLTS